MTESNEFLSPEYALWVFDVMLWLDELDEEQRLAVAGSILTGSAM